MPRQQASLRSDLLSLCEEAESPEIPSPPEEAGTRAVREERCRRLITANWKSSHPRVCGENYLAEFGKVAAKRAIPAVCGEHLSPGVDGGWLNRAIPACAGSTAPLRALVLAHTGPSPRVRGARRRCPGQQPGLPGHPRVCGEHRCRGRAIPAGQRAIPACAGSTFPTPQPLTPRAGHPRVCGEHLWFYAGQGDNAGPSPRVRGAPPTPFGGGVGYPGPSPRVRGALLVRDRQEGV